MARSSHFDHHDLTGLQLIDIASAHIASAVQEVGGRFVMIECKNDNNLIDFYTRNGFEEISTSMDGSYEMIQMIRKIV